MACIAMDQIPSDLDMSSNADQKRDAEQSGICNTQTETKIYCVTLEDDPEVQQCFLDTTPKVSDDDYTSCPMPPISYFEMDTPFGIIGRLTEVLGTLGLFNVVRDTIYFLDDPSKQDLSEKSEELDFELEEPLTFTTVSFELPSIRSITYDKSETEAPSRASKTWKGPYLLRLQAQAQSTLSVAGKCLRYCFELGVRCSRTLLPGRYLRTTIPECNGHP